MIRLGLCGRARSGKTTVASVFYNESIQYHQQKSFKHFVERGSCFLGKNTDVYDIGLAILHRCQDKGLIAPHKQRANLDEGDFVEMQKLGLEDRSIALSVIRLANAEVSIFPNIRYADEAAELRELGGHIIRVVRLNENGSGFISPDRNPNHLSETEHLFFKPDYVLTAYTGQDAYLTEQAKTLFKFIWSKAC